MTGPAGCLFLLLAGIFPYPVPAAAQDPVRVLIYNIRHGVGTDDRLGLARTAAVTRAQKPDVVLLQEVDKGTARAGGVDQARELSRLTGLPHHDFGAFMDFDGGEYGMAILSARPIRAYENHRLPPGPKPRSALAARTRPASGAPEMVFVGIHL